MWCKSARVKFIYGGGFLSCITLGSVQKRFKIVVKEPNLNEDSWLSRGNHLAPSFFQSSNQANSKIFRRSDWRGGEGCFSGRSMY